MDIGIKLQTEQAREHLSWGSLCMLLAGTARCTDPDGGVQESAWSRWDKAVSRRAPAVSRWRVPRLCWGWGSRAEVTLTAEKEHISE